MLPPRRPPKMLSTYLVTWYFIHDLKRPRYGIGFGLQADQEVARHLEAQPAGRHAGRDLEEVGHNALVESSYALLTDNNSDGVGDGLVLVAHSGHCVDLESST